jgi:hypothetical protein|tara:strand:- start:1180 stop:1512 length:333 start_codon:yes stop_codon:yes gene_type:complete
MAHKTNYKQNNRPERTKFNPSKFGSTWASIFWKGKPGLTAQGEANQPVIGSLNIGGKQFDLTFSECNKLIETLIDAKEAARTSKRLGTTSNGAGSPVSFMEVVSDMQQNQ